MDTVKVEPTPTSTSPAKKGIGLFDGVVFVLSCTIGSGLFFAPAESAAVVGNPWISLLAWLIAGVVSLAGSLVYSELGTSMVSAGAESFYLQKAFGPAMSFTFSWTMTLIIGPSACACISWVLASYVAAVFNISSDSYFFLFAVAVGVMLLLCAVNLVNPDYVLMLNRFNVICKVLAVLIVIIGGVIGFGAGFQSAPFISQTSFPAADWTKLGSAIMFACFALSGWNMLNPLTEEMTNPAKDVPKVYSLGMISTMVLALLVNAAFYAALDSAPLLARQSLARPFAAMLFAEGAGQDVFRIVFCILICFCCLGSCNGIMMGTSKCIASNGRDGILPRSFGVTSRKHQVPYVSVLFFTAWTSCLIVVLYSDPENAVEFIVNLYTVGQWGFFAMVGISLFVLRYKYPDLARPYRIHFYPVFPALFVLIAGFIVFMTFYGDHYKAAISATVIILFGTTLYYASKVDACRRIYKSMTSWIPDSALEEVELSKPKTAASPVEG